MTMGCPARVSMAAGVFMRGSHGKSVPAVSSPPTLASARAFVFDVDGTLALSEDPNAGSGIQPIAGAALVPAVLVGADPEFTYTRLVAACQAVWAGATLLVTSMAPWFASRGGRMPSTSGAIAAGITHVTGVSPMIVGKPSPLVLQVLG